MKQGSLQSKRFTNDAMPIASLRAGHYLGLDFLRGAAALAVVWYHCSTRLDLPLLFAHGYLAVDFFFVLSGFVIARAYGKRLESGQLNLPRFALFRVIRLMPLVVLGTLLAAVIELGRPGITEQHAHFVDNVLAALSGAFLVPIIGLTTLEHVVFPLNGPFWSLSLEAVANAAFALCARGRVTSLASVAALTICAPFLIWGTWTLGQINFGSLPDNYWLGYARVGWSFSTGIVLYGVRDRAPRVPFLAATIALIALTLVPPSVGLLGRSFDLFSVLFALPAIVWVASTAQLGPRGRRWAAWSGDLSYPVYALHYPVVRIVGLVGLKFGFPVVGRLSVVAVSTVLVVGSAGITYAFLDVPVRRWLGAKFLNGVGYGDRSSRRGKLSRIF